MTCLMMIVLDKFTVPLMVMLLVSGETVPGVTVALLVTLYPYTPGYLPVTVSVLT